jgi:hypothetical protein
MLLPNIERVLTHSSKKMLILLSPQCTLPLSWDTSRRRSSLTWSSFFHVLKSPKRISCFILHLHPARPIDLRNSFIMRRSPRSGTNPDVNRRCGGTKLELIDELCFNIFANLWLCFWSPCKILSRFSLVQPYLSVLANVSGASKSSSSFLK